MSEVGELVEDPGGGEVRRGSFILILSPVLRVVQYPLRTAPLLVFPAHSAKGGASGDAGSLRCSRVTANGEPRAELPLHPGPKRDWPAPALPPGSAVSPLEGGSSGHGRKADRHRNKGRRKVKHCWSLGGGRSLRLRNMLPRGSAEGGRGPCLLLVLGVLPLHCLLADTLDGCGHVVIGKESGTLTSKNYPGTYPNDTFCERRIKVPEGKKLHIKFGDLDIESHECESSYLKVFDGSSELESVNHCGVLANSPSEIYLKSNEATIRFKSGSHVSGRGFLLSFTSSDHPDLVTCLEKSNHFAESEFSRYCPAGCRDVVGTISGDHLEGYRDTSLLCKAAIHAGVIADEQGGRINVTQHKGIGRYEGVLANGILSVDGSLSDRRFMFNSYGCSTPQLTEFGVNSSGGITATSSWQSTNANGEVVKWTPAGALFQNQGPSWASSRNTDGEWLEIDLGERKRITGIITKGSTKRDFIFYVQSYKVQFSKEGLKWKTYKDAPGSVEKVFSGNDNFLSDARNSFLRPIVARYMRIVPHSWHQRIALKVELLGCRLTQGNASSAQPMLQKPTYSSGISLLDEDRTTTEHIPSEGRDLGNATSADPLLKKTSQRLPTPLVNNDQTIRNRIPYGESDSGNPTSANPLIQKPDHILNTLEINEDRTFTEPIPSEESDLGLKVAIIVAPAILSLLLLIGGICACATLRKKKTQGSALGLSKAQETGCWKQIKQPFARQQSTEFTISYSNDKDTVQKLDLVTCDMADFQLPLMVGTDTVTRKGSTFKPLDTEMKDQIGRAEIENHYDFPHRASRHEYALPLMNQEPEYATPIIERHTKWENTFTCESGYKVPVLATSPQLNIALIGISSLKDSAGGDYKSLQSTKNSEGEYDRPKVIQNMAAVGDSSDYQKPQLNLATDDGYASPRDCLKPISHTSVISA
ncbi:discoidin, CUB and LCCL domain-containing protein 1 [Pleurodeles waltl]